MPVSGVVASSSQAQSTSSSASVADSGTSSNSVSLSSRVRTVDKCSMIVPVYVYSKLEPERKVLVYAALDSQSDSSFVLQSIADELRLSGVPTRLSLSTMGAIDQIVSSTKVNDLVVEGCMTGNSVALSNVFTRQIMPCDTNHIPTPDRVAGWQHLSSIQDKLMPLADAAIALLIGYDCPAALYPAEVIPPVQDGPFAVRTMLGWSVVGPVSGAHSDRSCAYHVSVEYPVAADDDTISHHSAFVFRSAAKEIISPKQVHAMFDQDFSRDQATVSEYSQEDLAFMQCMQANVECVDRRYTAPLPFKADVDPKLPNNYSYARYRLDRLVSKMKKDTQYRTDYLEFMGKILSNEFAELVPESELSSDEHMWYLCHHGVYHPKKPTKIRIVFDASAKYAGTSLNANLLTGPDLTNPLLGVLIRFRLEHVALMCDVQQMFFQFRVAEHHRNYLRFLWFKDNDPSQPIVCYRMVSHIFGASSSPSVANFCLKKIAADHQDTYGSDAATFVRTSFYVDDGLLSASTPEKVIEVVSATKRMLQEGSCNLHKFVSNSQQVLDALAKDSQVGPVNLPGFSDIERALGLQWSVPIDAFVFSLNLPDKPCTRRGILAMVSAIYDPLGLIAPYVLEGKRVLQEICRLSTSWDTPLGGDVVVRFGKWVDTLEDLRTVSIPRCVKPSGFGELATVQLHLFSDASNQGYGACAYLRLVDVSGAVHCTLVLAKSRVTPSKSVTIPRLELNAAVVSSKMGFMLQRELSVVYEQLELFYWCDSSVTLGYIHNDAKRFHTFVSNRVQQVHDYTSKSAWHYVPTSENPADLASRGLSPKDKYKQSVWFNGPSFLQESDISAHLSNTSGNNTYKHVLSDSDPEVRTVAYCTKVASMLSVDCFKSCSSWERVVSTVVYCVKFIIVMLKCKFRTSLHVDISLDQVHSAQSRELCRRVIYKLIQQQYFAEEIKSLSVSEPVAKSSPLYKLKPFLDSQGLIRIGGRLSNSKLEFAIKYPVVLPSVKSCHLSRLIVEYFHKSVGHQGRGLTLSAVRNKGLWVLGSTASISSVVSACYHCKKLYQKPQCQLMADLPECRVEPSPPFSHVGVDLFGPFMVKEGRKSLKRYGVIFICMASRAVHIEVTCSLSTDAFISTLRRFIALRGSVRSLYCDRGTNFVGAESELRDAALEMSESQVADFLSQHSCDYVHFRFHVPHASHFGGAWERHIRSARRILSSLLRSQGSQLSDESLRTLMYEVSAIINSRPLTTTPSSTDLACPLSPQNLLTMKSGVVLPPPGKFGEEDQYAKRCWRRIQYLTEQFWSKWRKDYVANLQTRSKWSKVHRNLQVGDVVLLKDELSPRGVWSLCLVEQVYTSKDGKVRSAKVKVGDKHLSAQGKRTKAVSHLDRPVHKLVLIVPVDKVRSDDKH